MKVKVSTRVANCMANAGFDIKHTSYGLPSEVDKSEVLKFYEYCIEWKPGYKSEYWPYSKIPAGPEWKRLPNFGKKSFDEVCAIVHGSIPEKPMGCFGVMVPPALYAKLKRMAEEGQIRDI